jgi:hypothetical protein
MILGDLIERLEQEDRDLWIPIAWSNPHSYRGYYECVAFEPKAGGTIGECLDAARWAMGNTFTGWKGGEFTMHEYTDCYLASVGCLGEGLTLTLLELAITSAKNQEIRR